MMMIIMLMSNNRIIGHCASNKVTSNSVQLCKYLHPTNSITAAPSTLPFQLPVVTDQPQIRARETKPNPNVTLTLILTLTLLTLLTPRCNMIGRSEPLDPIGREQLFTQLYWIDSNMSHYTIARNFAKCWPIFKILSPAKFVIKLSIEMPPPLKGVATLPCEIFFLWTSWHLPLSHCITARFCANIYCQFLGELCKR